MNTTPASATSAIEPLTMTVGWFRAALREMSADSLFECLKEFSADNDDQAYKMVAAELRRRA